MIEKMPQHFAQTLSKLPGDILTYGYSNDTKGPTFHHNKFTYPSIYNIFFKWIKSIHH